jgi:hypothetical protein
MSSRRFPPPWSVGEGAPLSEVGRFNASSTIPVHGAGPWVIVETPTRHHTRRRGRPIPRRLLLGWSERVRIRQRLRAHICAGSGRTPGATPKKQRRHHARTRRGFFGNPRLFCAPTSTSKEEPGSVRGGQAVHPRRGPASPSISSSCRSRLRLRSRPTPLSACVLNRQFEIRR